MLRYAQVCSGMLKGYHLSTLTSTYETKCIGPRHPSLKYHNGTHCLEYHTALSTLMEPTKSVS